MPATRSLLYLGISLVFAAHNAEEAILAPALLTFMRTDGPVFLRAFYAGLSPSQMRSGLLLLTLIGLALGRGAMRAGTSVAWACVMLAFGGILALNALAHVALALAASRFMPGVATAVVLCLPYAGLVFARARREGWLRNPDRTGAP